MSDVFDIYSRGIRQLVLRRGGLAGIRTIAPPAAAGVLYSGVTSDPGPYTEGDILALGSQPGSSPDISLSLSPTVQYLVHAWPDSFGSLTSSSFYLGSLGFPGDMQEVQTGLSVDGVIYRVARSDHVLNATIPGAGGSQPLIVVS